MSERLAKVADLQRMLAQIAPANTIESVPRPPKDSEGLESVDAGESPIDTGLQKLAENRVDELTDDEIFGLEAIVLPQNRPVVFVRGAGYDELVDPWLGLNESATKARITALLPSVGRIEVPNLPQFPYAGTGFVVGKGLMMTNRHVAGLFSTGLGLKITYNAGDAAVDFKKQIDSVDGDRTAYLNVRKVEMVHPYWDMALLSVDGLPESRMLKLSVTSPEDLVGRNIIALGYPAKDWRNDIALQDRIFQGQYNVKRLQPGTVRPRRKANSFGNLVNALTHDASTLGGNSGSAIIDVEKGEVLALHFGGEYLKANYAVPMYELARDRRVASRLNFQGQLTPTNDWEPAWLGVGGGDAAATKEPEVKSDRSRRSAQKESASEAEPQPAAATPQVQASSAAGLSATWTIPIQVSITVGSPVQGSAPAARAADQVTAEEGEAEEAVVVDQDYSNRKGFDPDFLEGISVPLPKLSKTQVKDTAEVRKDARVHEDPYELAYHHYSVYMNKKRRTAWFSAANIDGDNRPDIGKREGDRWFRDPRILKTEQLGQEAFERGIDRGHLTRRQDTAWGEDVESAVAANNDTFHWTNCSLQAAAFNEGKDRWQGLEQFLLEKHAQKEKRRMTVITGPLFASNDPVYKNPKMDYSVRCPLQFWKVCVLIRQDGTPAVTGFILGQEEIANLPGFEESFDVAATQVKVSDLEKRTGLDFGELKKHDHFAHRGAPGTLEAPTASGETQTIRAIRSADDVVI